MFRINISQAEENKSGFFPSLNSSCHERNVRELTNSQEIDLVYPMSVCYHRTRGSCQCSDFYFILMRLSRHHAAMQPSLFQLRLRWLTVKCMFLLGGSTCLCGYTLMWHLIHSCPMLAQELPLIHFLLHLGHLYSPKHLFFPW